MIRLVLCDLRDHAATWTGAFLVAVACGFIGGFAASLMATARTYPNTESLAASVLVFSGRGGGGARVGGGLTVAAQRRSYALWQLANVGPRRVTAV